MTTPQRFQFGTKADFFTRNPVLAPSEIGVETDTGATKNGNGATAWNALTYNGTTGPGGPGGDVNVIDDLTTGGTQNALSAQQGVVLKAITDSLFGALGGKADSSAITEMAQDALAAAFAGGTHTGVTITYDDVANTFSFTVSGLAGLGDVGGPAASTDGEVALFSGLTGKLLKRSTTLTGWLQAASGVLTAVSTATLKAALAFTKSDVGLANVDNTSDANKPVSTAQAAYADGKVQNNMNPSVSIAPSATAVNSAIAAAVAGLYDLKGDLDASANPNYAAASKGDVYYISVAGKVGGASGKTVEVGDQLVAKLDNAGGTEAAVGTSWFVAERNLVGAATISGGLGQFSAIASAAMAALVTDETGSAGGGLMVFNNAPVLVNPTVGTQSAGDNSTKAASTAYADAAVSLVSPTAPAVVVAGFTFSKASHANRKIDYNSASPGNATFDGTAAFTSDDSFRLMQCAAGAVTLVASGVTFSNPLGLSLTTTGIGTYIDAEWDATIGKLVITGTGGGGAAFTGGNLSSAINDAAAVTLASAGTVNIGAAASNSVLISGTTAITAFDTIAASAKRFLTFQGALTLTHNATSLILPSGANITTAAGDVAIMESLGSGNWRCISYMKANGQAIVGGSFTGGTLTSALNLAPPVTVASAATTNIGAAAANTLNISGTTGITAFDNVAAGIRRRLIFAGACAITYNATSMQTPNGVNFTTAAGDVFDVESLGSGNWKWFIVRKGDGKLYGASGGQSGPTLQVPGWNGTGFCILASDIAGISTAGTMALYCDDASKTIGTTAAGWGLAIKEGTNCKQGTATLVAGVATVTNNRVTASSRIFVQRNGDGGTVGASYSISRSNGVSFTITAKDGTGANQTADTSTLAWFISEPGQ